MLDFMLRSTSYILRSTILPVLYDIYANDTILPVYVCTEAQQQQHQVIYRYAAERTESVGAVSKRLIDRRLGTIYGENLNIVSRACRNRILHTSYMYDIIPWYCWRHVVGWMGTLFDAE